MINFLAFDDEAKQVVVYDQGIGTNEKRLKAVNEFHRKIPRNAALHVLPGPQAKWFDPWGIFGRLLGLGFGYGLKRNVGEMWQMLADLYQGPEDKIYLFGFSRGAFAVRALAGLISRCGLPERGSGNFAEVFDNAYRLYQEWKPDSSAVETFRRDHSREGECRIHFLGIYDTVKSYGGIWPIRLPILRHNRIVDTVRHALALDEHRAWYKATSWGRLKSDEQGAFRRLTDQELSEIRNQSIEEVWFRGCHSDIGGSGSSEGAAGIALRWMLSEAAIAGLKFKPDAYAELGQDPKDTEPKVNESFNWIWWLVECFPRCEIDNSHTNSVRKLKWLWNGRRNPLELVRKDGGKLMIKVHRTAHGHGLDSNRVEVVETKFAKK
jgi:uncharacterized protein (DUF2235 family)